MSDEDSANDKHGVVAIRASGTYKNSDYHRIFLYKDPLKGGDLCSVFFSINYTTDERCKPFVDHYAANRRDIQYAKDLAAALSLAADIADAGWPEVTKIPTLEEYQAQQAELEAAAEREDAAMQEGVSIIPGTGPQESEARRLAYAEFGRDNPNSEAAISLLEAGAQFTRDKS